MIKLPALIVSSIGCVVFAFLPPGASLANPYVQTFNQSMGVASTGERVELLEVNVVIRGGYGTTVIYRIGRDIVESGVSCPYEGDVGSQPYFSDQGQRYAQSGATRKILSLACQYERKILTSSEIPSSSP